jgi:hypothetical protein
LAREAECESHAGQPRGSATSPPRSVERAPTPSCGFPDFGAVIDSWILFPERTQAPGMSSLGAIGGDL